MNKKMIAMGVSRMALLAVFVMVPMLTSTRTAFAQEQNPHSQVVLVDWVPMSATSKVKPPSSKDVLKALQKCLRKGQVGSSEFWTCFVEEIGLATWNANYPYIICAVKWYSGDQWFCGNCFHDAPHFTPCDNRCHSQNKCVTCCKIEGEKVIMEGHPSNYQLTIDHCMLNNDCMGQV